MPKRSEKREYAKAEYLARRARGETVNLQELAEAQGVTYQLLRNWKSADKWDAEVKEPKKREGGRKSTPHQSAAPTASPQGEARRKRGGQPGNRNSAGHQNAAGSQGAGGKSQRGEGRSIQRRPF